MAAVGDQIWRFQPSWDALLKKLRAQSACLFVGAGISRSAGVPLAREIIAKLTERFPDRFQQARRYGYAEAFETALPGRENQLKRSAFIESLFSSVPPGFEHRCIARLANRAYLPVIFTTNFDHLTEVALLTECKAQPRVYLHEDQLPIAANPAGTVSLVKLHGDYFIEDLANLDAEMEQRLSFNMKAHLERNLTGRALVVVGYSGSDQTVMRFLTEIAHSPNGLSNGVFWVIFDQSEGEKLEASEFFHAMRHAGKSAFHLGPMGPSEFLRSLLVDVQLALPKHIPFGAVPKVRHLFATHRRYGTRLQIPDVFQSGGSHLLPPTTALQIQLAFETPSFRWIVVRSCSIRDALLSEIATRKPLHRLFYFHPGFAGIPQDRDLLRDLEIFAGSINAKESRLSQLDPCSRPFLRPTRPS